MSDGYRTARLQPTRSHVALGLVPPRECVRIMWDCCRSLSVVCRNTRTTLCSTPETARVCAELASSGRARRELSRGEVAGGCPPGGGSCGAPHFASCVTVVAARAAKLEPRKLPDTP
eukprot:5210849-Prymnesium_polylepis.1